MPVWVSQLPQVDYVVLMISSVEVDVTWVDEEEWKQDDEDLNRVFASVHEISVKHIGLVQWRHAILYSKQQHNKDTFKANSASQNVNVKRAI